MEVSDCVATALTRARQARLPSPWPEAVYFLDLGPRASKKVEHWRARLLRKTERIDSLWSGRWIGNRQGDGIKKHRLSTAFAPSPRDLAQQTARPTVLRV